MNPINKIRCRFNEKRMERLNAVAKSLYQVREVNGALWLTFQGNAVVPASMLNEDILTVIDKLRCEFVEKRRLFLQ